MQTELAPSDLDPMRVLLARWKADPNAAYQTWFLWEDRLKNFRSIRRGIAQVVAEIEAGTFGNVVNGDQYYTETKVSSATIDLSPGGRVVFPSDLNKNVDLAVKPVHLEAGHYTLEIEVRSQPGSYLTVVVSDRDFSLMEGLP